MSVDIHELYKYFSADICENPQISTLLSTGVKNCAYGVHGKQLTYIFGGGPITRNENQDYIWRDWDLIRDVKSLIWLYKLRRSAIN